MNTFIKYISAAALLLPAFSCTEESTALMEPATVLESVSIVMDDETRAKQYTDRTTGGTVLPMIIGETITLGYTTVPEDISEITFPEMVWSSSNEDVVSVDGDGVLTALAAGNAVVTITSAAMNVVASASINVNVVETAVYVTSIQLSADYDRYDEENQRILCYNGDNLQFSATVSPEDATYKKVLWSVSDDTKASIDPVTGVFTALAIGNVDVIATSVGGDDPVQESLNVQVIEVVDPTGIKINNIPGVNDIFSLSQMTFAVDYDEWPEYSTVSRITWQSSDATVATVEDGVVTFRKYGNVTITATCPGEGDLQSGYSKSVSFGLNIPAGYYDDDFSDENWPWWENDSQTLSGSNCEIRHNDHGENYLYVTPGVQNSENWRCDIQRVPDDMAYSVNAANPEPYDNNVTFLSRENYPVICLRMDDVVDKGAENRSIFIDVNNSFVDGSGSYERIWSGRLGGSGANHWQTKYKCSDGSAILIYNLAGQGFQTGGQLPDTGVAVFPNFKIGYADIRTFESAEAAAYRFFWFKTFRSPDDLNLFLTGWSQDTGITYGVEE